MKNSDVVAVPTLSGWQTYKRLLRYTRPYIGSFILGIVGFLVYAQTQWVWAELIEYIVKAIENKNSSARNWIALAVIAIFVIRGLGSFLGNYGISLVARHVVHALRIDLFKHMLKLELGYYQRHNSGHLLSRITFNIEQVAGATTDAFKTIVQEGFTVLGLLVYLLYSNWKLSLLFVFIAPVIAAVVHYATKKLYRISRNIQDSMGDVTHAASESISAYALVKSYGGELYEQQRFAQSSEKNIQQGLKLVIAQSINTPLVQLLVAFAMAGVIWFALEPHVFGNTNAGEFLAFITAAGLLTKPIRQLTQVNSLLQRGIAGANSVFEVMDLPIENEEGVFIPEKIAGKIVFDSVSFHYPEADKKVLDQISFTILPGQKIALVGRTGSGKTTLVNLLPRFYLATQGCIYLDDHPLQSYQLSALRNQIAIVSQKVSLFNDTIRHNIAYGALQHASESDINQAVTAANLKDWVSTLPMGLETVIGEDGVQLSGGQRQRIAIARAILKNAPILILDEATSALDNETEKQIQQALERLMKGRTTFIIAHRLSTVELADVIFVVEAGQIIEQGDHRALLACQGAYAKLHAQAY